MMKVFATRRSDVSRDQRCRDSRRSYTLLGILLLLMQASVLFAGEEPEWLPGLLEKERLTIVVTDSGLGGLSVAADAERKFSRHSVFREVDLFFVNALFRNAGGYNSLPSRDEKLAVFSAALQAMEDRYDPDLILVACNTLSVLAPDTDFARTSQVPVADIVDVGVEQIADALSGKPGAQNLMFATQTTVDEGTHRAQLLELGIEERQFAAQACPQLSFYIEQGFDAMDTELLIDAYVDEALSGMGKVEGPINVSFNCTHFGYALASWELAFESRGVEVAAFLDPNTRMVDFLLPESLHGRYPSSDVSVRAVSMVAIPEASIDSIGRYLHGVSPATETALREYERIEGLFDWRPLVTGAGD